MDRLLSPPVKLSFFGWNVGIVEWRATMVPSLANPEIQRFTGFQ